MLRHDPDASNPAVLIVEDDRDLSDLYGEFIPEAYPTGVVYSGSEALERLTPSLDVLILDRDLDDVSGSAVVEQARSNGIDCAIIVVSGYDAAGVDFDYDAYLQKPVAGKELVKTFTRLSPEGRPSSNRSVL